MFAMLADRFFPTVSNSEIVMFLLVFFVLEGWTLRLEESLLKQSFTWEGVYFAAFAARQFTKPLEWSSMGFLVGLAFCTFERFCIGYVFHHLTWYEKEHMEYHKRLVRRKLFGERQNSDDWQEIVTYTLLFWSLYGLVWNQGFWVGVATEHYLGYRLRTLVQYTPTSTLQQQYEKAAFCKKWKCRLLAGYYRFLLNSDAFYWMHVVVNPQTCFGFSSPCWDMCFQSSISWSGRFAWVPLPFVGLVDARLFSKYESEIQPEKLMAFLQ